MVGQNFLRSPFGASSLIAVEIAWGADSAADPDTWTWTDITTDVRQEPGISIAFGRGDEASTSQPARCSFVVNNRSGAYSLGGESSNWPNVRKGTPIRIRVDPTGAGFVDPPAFQGEALGFTPDWNLRGNDARVVVAAAGALRRLGQGQAPVQSALRRGIPTTSGLLSYWPCEEGPEAHGFVPAVGQFFMSWTGTPKLAASSTLVSSAPLPQLNGSVWFGAVTPSPATGTVVVRFVAEFPGESAPDQGVLCSIRTSGTAARYDLVYDPSAGGVLAMVAYDEHDSIITFTAGVTFAINSAPLVRRYDIELIQTGSDVVCYFGTVDAVTADDSGYGVMTVTSRTLGVPVLVLINGAGSGNPEGALEQVAVGHVAVYDNYPGYFPGLQELIAYRGEPADTRMARLCEENGEAIEITGVAPIAMGPQTISTLLDLLRECETADGGVLYDGRGPGLSYVCRDQRENQSADLTIAAAATPGQLAEPFGPVDDDQRTRNRVTVTRTSAGNLTAEDTTGPLGTDAIGVYDTSITVNVATDGDALRYAEWLVHLGTQEDYRYPSIPVNVRAAPTLARTILAVTPSNRVDVTGIGSKLRSFPSTDDLRTLVEGASMRIASDEFSVQLNASPYDAWKVATMNPASDGTAITVVGASAALYGSNTTGDNVFIVPLWPTYARTGDFIIVYATIRNSGTGTCPAPDGHTMLLQSGNCSIYGRFIRPADVYPDDLVSIEQVVIADGVPNATVAVRAFALRGVHPDVSQLVHASDAQLNASAQNIDYPALTVTEDDCIVMAFGWKQDDWTSVATLAGMTELIDDSTTFGDDAGIVMDYVVQSTAASLSSGSFTVTGGASAISRGLALALRPAPTAATTAARGDTDGSTLAASIAAGATSMSVETTAAGPISYLGIGLPDNQNNASVTPPLPTGLEVGDLVVAVVSIRNSGTGTVVVPDGWFDIKTSGNLSVLGRYYQDGDAAQTFTFSGGAANATTQAQCFALRGVAPNVSSVLNTSIAQLNGSAQNISVPGLVASHDDVTMVVVGWKQDDWTSVATLSGQLFTEAADSPTTVGDDSGIEIQYRLGGFTNAGTFTTTSLTVTGGASAISRAIVLAFEPSAVGCWSTSSFDYPMDLDVGGVKITATACSDARSPQTMTITAAPVARSAGVPVKLWKPSVVGR